jgi:hypothetical protein
MGNEATVKNEGGEKERFGLTRLDVLCHAVKTTINSLQENDRLSLIIFSDKGEVLIDLSSMNEENKLLA